MSNSNLSKRISYRAFGDTEEFIKDLFEVYSQAYELEIIENNFTLTDKYSFEYCNCRKHFILVLPYTPQKNILLERVFSNNTLQWTLIGGSFKKNETFVECAS